MPANRTDAGHVTRFLSALALDRPWRVTVEEYFPRRSNAQNAYWFAVPVKLLSDATGYERKWVHEYLLGTHFGWKDQSVPKTPRNPDGLASVPIRTTTTGANGEPAVLSTVEFMDLIAFAQRFGASKGVYIPDPNEEAA